MAELTTFSSGGQGRTLLLNSADFRKEWAFLPSSPANTYDQNCFGVRLTRNRVVLGLYVVLLAASLSTLLLW